MSTGSYFFKFTSSRINKRIALPVGRRDFFCGVATSPLSWGGVFFFPEGWGVFALAPPLPFAHVTGSVILITISDPVPNPICFSTGKFKFLTISNQ